MRFIIDQPVSPLLAEWLTEQGHDAFHVRDRGLSNASDHAIVELAYQETRILVTTDLDFSRIVALSSREGPPVILFRAGNLSDTQRLALLKCVLHQIDAERLERSIVVATAHSLRVAKLPLR